MNAQKTSFSRYVLDEQLAEMQKTITRWAVHKIGTEQIGYLYSSKAEADELLSGLMDGMKPSTKKKYAVIEVQVAWNEQ